MGLASIPTVGQLDADCGRPVIWNLVRRRRGLFYLAAGRVGLRIFTTKSNNKSTGLSLAMAKGFVEQSGGALRITSELHPGTTLTLRLPCAEIDARQTLLADAKHAQDTKTHQAHAQRRRILLVDDEALLRNALADDLAALGWNVVTAATGAGALA